MHCFESGLFEEATEKFLALMRQDPGDTDAQFVSCLIKRRLTPPPPPGPATLIWQVDPAKVWEGEWVRSLLSGCVGEEVVDTTWSATAPRMVVADNGLGERKERYYRQAFDRGCRIVLVHLSDEAFADDTGVYRYCEAVLRNYRSEILADQVGVHFFPLGYKAGFARRAGAARPAADRRYLWSFAGDAKKMTRRSMLAEMKALPRGFVHLTQGFGSGDSLSTDAYRALLDDTVVVPCPGGWTNLETFRVYEALEAGCIPIVEQRPAFDYFSALLGVHPLPTVSSWVEAADLIQGWSPEQIEAVRRSCERWWLEFKARLSVTLTASVAQALDGATTPFGSRLG